MKGIRYLRKILGMSGEEFGKTCGVTKYTVSKWEKGQLPISERKKQEISDMFGCSTELLDKEVNNFEQMEIQRNWCYRQSSKFFDPNENFNLEKERINAVLIEIKELICKNPLLINNIDRFLNILNNEKGLETLNILFSAAESYIKWSGNRSYVVNSNEQELLVTILKIYFSKIGENENGM